MLRYSIQTRIFIIACLATQIFSTKTYQTDIDLYTDEESATTDPCSFSHTHHDKHWLIQQIPEGNCSSQVNSSGAVHLACTGGLEYSWLTIQNHAVRHLTILQWPLVCFPLALVFDVFPSLRNLSIVDSSTLSYFSEDFPPTALHLKHLRLSGLTNLTLETTLLSELPALEDLDLRGNRLETLDPDLISSAPNLKTVLLSYNQWNCSHENFRWLSDVNSTSMVIAKERIADYKNLTCQGNLFKGKPVHVVMELFKSLRLECPPTCSCSLTNLVRPPGKDNLLPISTVDCRHRGLTELPPVPAITTVLLLHGNMISSVRPLAQDPAYRHVADVYLDDNLVTSLAPLEGADWMQSFRVLSVRGNNITHLPTHVFDNAFQYNRNVVQVFFGQNPWRCDCQFTPGFQELLLKYQKFVEDLPNVTCARSENKDISNAPIQTLSRSTICRQPSETMQPLDILNVILSCLIVLVLGKFAYDYYCFKKTGKLPWIVSKMP